MDKTKIQIIADNPAEAEKLKSQLESEGYEVTPLFTNCNIEQKQSNADILFVKKMRNIVKVPIETIQYIEVTSNYSTLSSTIGNFTIKLSLTELLKRLPKKDFIRVHKNYAVNLKEINEFNFEEFTVRLSKKNLPIGKKYKNHIKENLNILY